MWLIFLLALFIKTEAESAQDVECGLPKYSTKYNRVNRIVGGWEAGPLTIPWQVRLNLFYGDLSDGYCGGSLVRLQPGNQTRFVLTAAHCVVRRNGRYNRSASDIKVLLGARNVIFPEPKWEVVSVEKYTRGPYDHKTMAEDIALLYLQRPVTFTARIRPVCLPRRNSPLPKKRRCFISGWGLTSVSGSFSPVLQMVDVKILEDDNCDMDSKTKEKSFCAGHLEGSKDACDGDSGGPLVCRVKGRFFLYGITSYGIGCGLSRQPGVYTEVAKYIDWINDQGSTFGTTFNLFTDTIYQDVK